MAGGFLTGAWGGKGPSQQSAPLSCAARALPRPAGAPESSQARRGAPPPVTAEVSAPPLVAGRGGSRAVAVGETGARGSPGFQLSTFASESLDDDPS